MAEKKIIRKKPGRPKKPVKAVKKVIKKADPFGEKNLCYSCKNCVRINKTGACILSPKIFCEEVYECNRRVQDSSS